MSNAGDGATGPDPPPRALPGGRLVATVVQGHTFSVDRRYEPKKILGKGSFGVVCTAFDSVRGENIAIKRIRPFANDEWDARHTLREIRLMKILGKHPNVITLYDLSLFDEKSELYMMMELMDCDLHRIIQSKQPLNDAHYKCFARQMLEGLKAMHAIGIFHRDLKPGNLLVSKDCQLRITDFGLARFMDEETLAGDNRQNPMTEYVVTRWYRCPELLLAPKEPYSCAIDLWSIGCIIGELIKRKPLFPGKSHANQVQLILEVRGYRGAEDLGFGLTQEAQSFLDRRCRYPGQPLSAFIPQASPTALELLEGLLQLNPAHRPTAAQALSMPYIADAQALHDYSSPQCHLDPIPSSFFDFERNPYSLDVLRQMIRDEVKQSSSPGRSGQTPIASPGSVPANAGGNQGTSPPLSSKSTSNRSGDQSASSASASSASSSSDARDSADARFIRTETSAIDRSGAQAVEAPYSQAPTAVRGLRRMSTNEIDEQTQQAAQNILQSETQVAAAPVEEKPNKPKSSVVNPFQRVASKVIPAANESSTSKASEEQQRAPKVALVPSSAGDAAERPSKRTPKTPSPGKMETIAKQERKQKRIFFLQSMQRQQMEGGSSAAARSQAQAPQAAAVREAGVGFSASGSSGFLGMVNYRRRESSGSASTSQQPMQTRSGAYPRPNVPPLAMQQQPQQQQAAPSGGSSSEIANLFSQFQSQSFSAREPAASSSTASLALRRGSSRVPSTAPAAAGGVPASSSSSGLGAVKPSRFPSLGR